MAIPATARNVANFIVTYIFSALGYEFIYFTMTLYIYDLSKSALSVSLFITITFLPRLISPLYGSFIDRYPRKKVLISSLLIVISLVLLLSQIQALFFVYLLWAVVTFFLSLISTVRTAIMTEVLHRDGFLLGNSMVLVLLNVARIIAPLLGALVIKITVLKYLFFITAGIYLVTFCMALFIQLPSAPERPAKFNFREDFKEGFAYIIQSPMIRYLNVIALIRCLFVGMQSSLFVIYIKSYLSLGSIEYGYFISTIAAGSIAGSLLGPWLIKRVDNRKIITWSLVGYYGLLATLGLSRSYYLSLLIILGSFICFYVGLVRLHSLRDIATEVNLRGRVYTTVSAMQNIAFIFSILTGGWLSTIFSVEKVLLGAGSLGALMHFVFTYRFRPLAVPTTENCREAA